MTALLPSTVWLPALDELGAVNGAAELAILMLAPTPEKGRLE